MKKFNYNRRDFLKFLSLLPIGFVFGCRSDSWDTDAPITKLDTKESFKKLIVAFGPWSSDKKAKAEDFAKRFVTASINTAPYNGEMIKKIAGRVPDNSIGLKKIDLTIFPDNERKTLIKFIQQLYSYLEIRNFTVGEPEFGLCQVDKNFYTKALN
jgi:hypothetical protein